MQVNNILYGLQHSFRHHQSFVHELMYNYDNNIQSDIILMDFSKLFNKVPHQLL